MTQELSRDRGLGCVNHSRVLVSETSGLPATQPSASESLSPAFRQIGAAAIPAEAHLEVCWQDVATGEVDQVSTGVTLPVPEVVLAVKVMVPAVCA